VRQYVAGTKQKTFVKSLRNYSSLIPRESWKLNRCRNEDGSHFAAVTFETWLIKPGYATNKGKNRMNTIKLVFAASLGMLLVACGGGGSTVNAPGAPTGVSVVAGANVGTTASVSFTAPESNGGGAITGYAVTANPGAHTATGTASPIILEGLSAGTDYTFSVTASNSAGSSAAATTRNINNYHIVETFHEPDTQPNDTIFTGSFTYNSITQTVSNLAGSLTQSMTKADPTCVSTMMSPCAHGGPMTTVSLNYQLFSVSDTTLGGSLVTTFALNSTDVFDLGGFAPGGSIYFGKTAGIPNNHNAYAMIFVNTTDPTTALTQAQLEKLAYADCTAGGMMMSSCMTGTTVAGYGTLGTMKGYPATQVITKQ
jgi:hypothetical protein